MLGDPKTKQDEACSYYPDTAKALKASISEQVNKEPIDKPCNTLVERIAFLEDYRTITQKRLSELEQTVLYLRDKLGI